MGSTTIESTKRTAWSTKQCFSLGVISLILGIIIFVFAYNGMSANTGIGAYNQSALSWMIGHRDIQLTNLMKIVTTTANLQIYTTIICIGAIIWAIIKREIWRPLVFAISIGIAAVVSTELKLITMNLRPAQTLMIAPFELDFSFPSGHTISIAVCLLVLGYLIYSRHYNAGQFIRWIIIAILGTGLIATSRLYLGYHWFTDIAGSIGLGLIIFALVIFVDRLIIGKLYD